MYSVLIPCRNEEKTLEQCLNALLLQSIKPNKILLVDDNSTDKTPYIYNEYNLNILKPKYKRHKDRDINYAMVMHHGFNEIFKNINDESYLLKLDADIVLEDKNYIKKIITMMENDINIGIGGGISPLDKLKKYVNDGAKIYRIKCLKELLEPNGYPIRFGVDSLLQFKAINIGWKLKPTPILYKDLRPYKRNIKKWFYYGKMRCEIGFNIPHMFLKTIINLREKPYFIGAMISYLSFLISHLNIKYNKDKKTFIIKNKTSIIYFIHEWKIKIFKHLIRLNKEGDI